ncbi:MAG: alpha-ketoacid dehydrogenase subunit beta [Clostridia bacterium]|nr:alpha-ketoacid dehydrogenase subunit beta [Clostridia bacterium]
MPWTRINESELLNRDRNAEGRRLKYTEAIREALYQAMKLDDRVFVMGQGINDKTGMFGATTDLWKEFGEKRVFETPLSEAGLTGIAVGAAAAGMRPFYCHNRPDFLMLAMDQLVNHASKMNFMSNGKSPIPMVIWATTGMGWGSAAQHSQALHGLFMHVPGLKMVMPTNPFDAKGLVLSAIADNNPVLIFEHRRVFNQIGLVPEEPYYVPIGKAKILKEGSDVTLLAVSHMVIEAEKIMDELESRGVSAELIDVRSLKPLDTETILNSVRKTGRVVIADTGWKTGGVSAEISAMIAENAGMSLKSNIIRVAATDVPTPASYVLEEAFYRNSQEIKEAVLKSVGL